MDMIVRTQRQPGVDLFRCLGLLFVNTLHAFLYNGFYFEAQTGVLMWLANTVRWLTFGCNGMFMLMTGYLKSEKPWNLRYYKGLLTVLTGYVLTCLISYPIRHFLLGEQEPLPVWIERFFTFSNYAWYVEMYIGLILISPLVNLALRQLTDRQVLLLAGTLLLVTTLPQVLVVPGQENAFSLLPDYWSAMYPLTYYMLGAAIARCQPKLPSWAGQVSAVTVAMILALLSLASTAEGFSTGFTQGYGGLWIMLMVVLLFLGVYRLPIPEKTARVLSWASAGVFEGYILSRLLDVWVYGLVPQWHTPARYPLVFLCITLPVFVLSLLAGKAVHTLSVKLTK